MEIVINISKRVYDDICDGVENADICGIGVGTVERAIANGIPLPENHGRLKDENTIQIPYDICDGNEAMEYVHEAPIIIEADKESKNGCIDYNINNCYF